MRGNLWDVFKTNKKYYIMMASWHEEHGGCAVEEKIKRIILEHSKGNVLDAGCGEGTSTKWFAEQAQDAKFYGIDISPIGIELAKRVYVENCEFLVGELEHIAFKQNSFHLIYSQSVLEHVKNIKKVLKEFNRSLKPGGKLIIRMGNGGANKISFMQGLMNYVLWKNKMIYLNPTFEIREGCEIEDHMTNFDAQEIPSDILLKMLNEENFKILYFRTTESYRAFKPKNIKQHIKKILMLLPFWPFNHLGSTIFLLAEARK